eukprot:2294734-Pyramimonas_sp.AAC.1
MFGLIRRCRAEDMCDAPANIRSAMLFRDPGFLHTAVVPGLNPRTLYYYKVRLPRLACSFTDAGGVVSPTKV